MGLTVIPAAEAAATFDSFDAIIDARSPSEHAEDHLPGALNWFVLSDDERRIVGTRYRQVSAFEARRLGAVMVARNVATHLEREAQDKPPGWRPLVYCWRGGLRSSTLAWFMDRIGFRTHLVEGGYKAFRAAIVADTTARVPTLDFRVLCGRTGSGKTRLLQALAAQGAQVLDLESMACHRGSVLGGLPDVPQPSQKAFEMALWNRLRQLDPARPVYVESESQRIGLLRVPEALIERMRREGRCLDVRMPDAARVQLLLEDYAWFGREPERFCKLLDALVELRGRETVKRWQAQAHDGQWAEVFASLMRDHYDPLYLRSMGRQFAGFQTARVLELPDGGPGSLDQVARGLLEDAGGRSASPVAAPR